MKQTVLLLLTMILIFTAGCKQNKQLKVACIGTGFTRGYGLPDRNTYSYPAQLQYIAVSNWDVRNFSCTGISVIRKSSQSYWDTVALKEAIDFKPDIIVMELGHYDIAKRENRMLAIDNLENDFSDLVLTFQNLPSKPEIILLIPSGFHTDKECRKTDCRYLQKINKEIAMFHNLKIINLHDDFRFDKKNYQENLCYPSIRGSKAVAKKVYSFLVKNVLDKQK